MKIRPVGAELFRVDRPTDMTKLYAILRTRLKLTASFIIAVKKRSDNS